MDLFSFVVNLAVYTLCGQSLTHLTTVAMEHCVKTTSVPLC